MPSPPGADHSRIRRRTAELVIERSYEPDPERMDHALRAVLAWGPPPGKEKPAPGGNREAGDEQEHDAPGKDSNTPARGHSSRGPA